MGQNGLLVVPYFSRPKDVIGFYLVWTNISELGSLGNRVLCGPFFSFFYATWAWFVQQLAGKMSVVFFLFQF